MFQYTIRKELPMKKIAILQSNYIPWKGYFDLINLVKTDVGASGGLSNDGGPP